MRFELLPGQRNDIVGVAPLLDGACFDALLADKAFDADWLRADLQARGCSAVIPPRRHRKQALDYDKAMYEWRHLIENFFAKLKDFKAIAMRCEKTDRNFTAMLYACAAVINSQ